MQDFGRIETTAERLKKAMEKRGMRQIDIVRTTGIDKGSISNYVKGKYEPKQEIIYKIAKALDVSEMWLWGYNCEMDRTPEQKDNDIIADIIVRLRTDKKFFTAAELLEKLEPEQLEMVVQFLKTFVK